MLKYQHNPFVDQKIKLINELPEWLKQFERPEYFKIKNAVIMSLINSLECLSPLSKDKLEKTKQTPCCKAPYDSSGKGPIFLVNNHVRCCYCSAEFTERS